MSISPPLQFHRVILSSVAIGALLVCASNLRADQLANPTITASARPFNASFGAANVFDTGTAEYASLTQGAVSVPFTTDPNNGTWIQFDFGATVTFDTFINSSRNNAVDLVGANRLIVSADPTFDATDTIVNLAAPGPNSIGVIQRFNPVSGRYVRWEVVTRT